MSIKKIAQFPTRKKHSMVDALMWENLNRLLESKRIYKPVDKAAFLGVSPQQFNGWDSGVRGFGKKTIARFIEKTGLTEQKLYNAEEIDTEMGEVEKLLKDHPHYEAAISLLKAGDIETADKVMRQYLERKYALLETPRVDENGVSFPPEKNIAW